MSETRSFTNTTELDAVVHDFLGNPLLVPPGETVTWEVPDFYGGHGIEAQPHIDAPSDGNVQDAEARASLSTLLSELEDAGVLESS